jgi:hypothetical protein
MEGSDTVVLMGIGSVWVDSFVGSSDIRLFYDLIKKEMG